MDESYLEILRMVQDRVISAEEGGRLLDALDVADGEQEQAVVGETTVRPSTEWPEERGFAAEGPAGELTDAPLGPPRRWQTIWIYPLAAGILLLALGGVLTGNLIQRGYGQGWLACTIPLLIFGALVALLAWWSRSARWLHLYVRDEDKEIRISLPLPLRFAAWVLRLARPWSPKLRETAVDELILSLAEADLPGSILTVEVSDEEDGEEVRVYIG